MSDINLLYKKYANKKWVGDALGYVVYKRTYSRKKEDGSFEEWNETLQRCITGIKKLNFKISDEELAKLYDYNFNLKCSLSGRGLWQLNSKTVDKLGGDSLINCWVSPAGKVEDFCFIMNELMLGGGVGVVIKREIIHQLPKVINDISITRLDTKDADFIVPDTREGWIELLRKTLEAYLHKGKGFTYSLQLIRGKGALINGFGGISSGGEILHEGIQKIIQVLKARDDKRLRSLDVLDIIGIIGSIVVSGNVRRSAIILLGDPDDILFMRAKRWDLGVIPSWRAMSNNTIGADDYDEILDEFWKGYNGDGEAYGLANIKLARTYGRLGEKKKDKSIEGVNPCQPSWAKLLTPDGIKQMKDVNIGDIIWSKEGWTKIVNKWSTGIKEVYKYKTNAGIFYGTENHRLVSNGEKIEAKDCDSIDILRGEYNKITDLDIQDIMDGLVVGDGSIHKASNNLVHLCIGKDDQDYFTSEINSLIVKQRKGLHDFAYEIDTTITANELVKTYNREVPDRFYYGNRKKVCGFLRGLFTANGGVSGNRITLKASSKKIIEQVQTMLSSIGIKSYITTNKAKDVLFNNGVYTSKESYDINISTDRVRFRDSIGFIQGYKNDKVDDVINKMVQKSKEKNNYDITSVELVSEEEVFDITVDNESHTYWTEGCDVSNCAEILEAFYEACNLFEIFLPNIKSKKELFDVASLGYKYCKNLSAMNFLHEETNKIVRKNMRLGLSVTGICDATEEQLSWLDEVYKDLVELDKKYSKENGWNESIRLTCVKPSGTLSLLAGVSAGVHPNFSKYYIRRVTMNSDDSLVDICKKAGLNVEYRKQIDGSLDYNSVVVEFPKKSKDGALLVKDVSAITQLELVKKMQTIWADNSVSVTVYYKKEELDGIKEWLKENYKTSVKTVSFMLHNEHGFEQAPYEEITEEKYNKLIKNVDYDILLSANIKDGLLDLSDCDSGSCPVR